MDELLNAHADPSHKDRPTGWLDGWMAGWLDFQMLLFVLSSQAK